MDVKTPSGPSCRWNQFHLRQVWAAIVFSQGHLSAGAAIGFISVFLTQESQQPSLHLTKLEMTWTVSAFPVGMVLGNLVSAVLTPLLGYRRLVLLSAPCSLAAWVMLALSHQFLLILLARILSGVFIGTMDGPARAYICETASRDLRGPLGMFPNFFLAINMLIVFGLSSQLNWRVSVLVAGVVPYLLQFFAVLVLPEASKWLLAHGHSEEEAKKSIVYYSGEGAAADQQLQETLTSMRAALGVQMSSWTRTMKLFSRRSNLHPLLLVMLQLLLAVYNPGEAVSNFSTVIFASVSAQHNPYYSSIYTGLARIVGFIMSAWLIERLGRIRLIQTAAALQLCGGLLVGCYFQLALDPGRDWMVVLGCVIIYFAYGVGIMPVTWVLFSELLPNAVRSVSINVLLTLFGLVMFSFVHMYSYALDLVGLGGIFWALSAMNFLQIVYAGVFLPETKGLSLEEIQKKYFERDQPIEPAKPDYSFQNQSFQI